MEQETINNEKIQERWDSMVWDLQNQHGWSPRKAKRYLDSIAKRQVKKVMKGQHRHMRFSQNQSMETTDQTTEPV